MERLIDMLQFYGEQSNRICKKCMKIKESNHIAGLEIFAIVGGLQGNFIASNDFYNLNRPLVFIGNRDCGHYEVIYERLEQDTLDYIKQYLCCVETVKVDDVEEWCRRNVKTDRNTRSVVMDEGV